MKIKYNYPEYKIDIKAEVLDRCIDIAKKLLKEVGILVKHEKFLDGISSKKGIRISGDRVYFDEKLIQGNLEKIINCHKETTENKKEWKLKTGGFSMYVIDIATDEVKLATCQDLRDLIKLKDSYNAAGSYPVMPQDIPVIMRAIACFKICYESSDKTRPYDYLDISQTKYIYEMNRVVGKPFSLTICIPETMRIDEKDLEIFLNFYPQIKRNKDVIFDLLDYPMLGLMKPVTTTGCISLGIAHSLGVYTLFNSYDPEIEVPLRISAGAPVDLRGACWAWGSPRTHLYDYMNSIVFPKMCGIEPDRYVPDCVLLASSSSAVDAQAALEKMGVAMTAALQGARCFSYAGSLCVDDLFSGTQFVIDVEIVNYIRETIESFNPHPDIMNMDGLYEMLKDVSLGKEIFPAHPDTVARFRNILPSSDLLYREKLSSWLTHKKTLKHRAKEEALKRIKDAKYEFHLASEKQKELDRIYKQAERELI